MGKAKVSEGGRVEINYTDEERIAIFERACEVFASQHCTIDSACKSVGLSERTFRLWKVKYAELAETYKKARAKQFALYWEDLVTPRAESALIRLLKGETKTEKKVEDLTDKGLLTGQTKETTTTTEILPHATITMFAMKAVHPDKFDKDEEVTHLHITFDDDLEPPKMSMKNEPKTDQDE